MSKCHYFLSNEKLPDHIPATKKFINEISRNFVKIVFVRKGKEIHTTDRISKHKPKTVQLRKNANFNNHTETIYGTRYAVRKNKVEIQTYRFTKVIENPSNPKESIYVQLVNLLQVEPNQEEVNIKTTQLSNLGWQATVYAETQNLNYLFKNNYLRYVSKFIQPLEPYDMRASENKLIRIHKYQNIIEVLDNMNNHSVIRSLITGNNDMRVLTLNYLKKHRKWLKRDLDVKQINSLDFISKYYKLNDHNLTRIRNNDITANRIKEILLFEKKNDIKPRKLLRYLDKQNKRLYYYEDYIRMMSELGRDTTHWTRQFPKDLRAAHDLALKKTNEQIKLKRELEDKKRELEDKKRYEEHRQKLQEIKKLEKISKDNEYALLVPKDLSDIIEEGQKLSHCVSGSHYVNKHAKKHLILFVRKIENLNEPYFTLQLDDKGKIVQLHGYGNEDKTEKGCQAKEALPEVKEFVESVVYDKEFQNKYKKIVEETFG